MISRNTARLTGFLIVISVLFKLTVLADTLILKNGNMIPCVVREMTGDRFTIEAEGKIQNIQRNLVESVLMTEFVTGVYGDEYKNFSFRMTIKKPPRWFFIPNASALGNNLVVVSRTTEPKITDVAMILSVFQLPGTLEALDDMELRQEVETELRRRYPDYIRFPPEIRPHAGTRALFQQATELVPYLGEKVRYLVKQVAIPWGDRLFVFTARDKMVNFSQNEPDFDMIVNSLEFMDRTDVFGNLGYLFMKRKDYRTATRYFFEAVKLYPSDADIHNKLGMCLGMTGRYEDAISSFKRAIRLNPNLDEARFNLENTSTFHYSGSSL